MTFISNKSSCPCIVYNVELYCSTKLLKSEQIRNSYNLNNQTRYFVQYTLDAIGKIGASCNSALQQMAVVTIL